MSATAYTRILGSGSEDLANETMLPDQWRALLESHTRSGEQRMLLARLWQTLEDLRKYRTATGRQGRQSYASALRWVQSTSKGPKSFIYCCEIIGWEPSWIRKGLLAEPKERAQPVPRRTK